MAYLVFGLLPWSEIAPHSLQVSVLLLLCFLLLVARPGESTPGVGAVRAEGIDRRDRAGCADGASGPDPAPAAQRRDVVGFLPVVEANASRSSRREVLPPGSLLDVVRNLRVDEVIVAVRERRGGVLSLRELLDCKLLGTRILDLSTFFERVQGQVRLDSLRCELADLRRRLSPGLDADLRQALLRSRGGDGAPARCDAGDAGHRVVDPPGGRCADLLLAGAGGAGRPALPRDQVPQHASGCREGRQAEVGQFERRSRDARRALHPQAAHRRASAAVQRAQLAT